MTFVVVFIKFVDFSIGGNMADKRKIKSKNIEPEAARERFLKLNQIWNKKC